MSATLLSTDADLLERNEPLEIDFEGKRYHTGYSRISKYQACPRQYKLVYVDGHRGISTTPMRRGNAYHDTLEAALRHKMDEGKAMRLSKIIERATYAGEQHGLKEKEIEEVRGAARLWDQIYYPNLEPLFVEEKFRIARAGVTFTGRLDAGVRMVRTKGGRLVFCDRKGLAIDHKFSFDLWTDARAKESVQPIIYQWAWEDVYERQTGLAFGGFHYQVLRSFPYFAAETLKIHRVAAEGSLWMEQNLREVAEAMCKGCYFARPSVSECSRCSFKADVCQPVLYRIGRDAFGTMD